MSVPGHELYIYIYMFLIYIEKCFCTSKYVQPTNRIMTCIQNVTDIVKESF